MCRKLVICTAFILAILAMNGQARASYKLFKSGNDFKAYGLFAGAGIVKAIADDPRVYIQPITSTTSYNVIVEGHGKAAPFVEVGGFSVMRYGPIRLIDFGFSYRKVKGEETANAYRLDGSDLSYPRELNSTGTFVHHRTAFRMNFHFAIPIGKSAFIHTGPGIDARLTIKLKEHYELNHIDIDKKSDMSSTTAGLNYLIGLGWKVGPGKFMDLYAYSPLLNFERDGFASREPIFNSEYRLLTVGLRLIWLQPTADRTCPGGGGPGQTGARFSSTKNTSGRQPW
jgi:hypothetical protein